MKWDPTVLKEDAARSLFRYKTKVIKKTMKPELKGVKKKKKGSQFSL